MDGLSYIVTLGRVIFSFFIFIILLETLNICKNKIMLKLNRPFRGKSDFSFLRKKYPIWVYLLILALIINQIFFMLGDKTKLEGLYEIGNHTNVYHAQLSPKGKNCYIPVVVEISTIGDDYGDGYYVDRYINKLIFEEFEIDTDFHELDIKSAADDTVTASFHSYNGWDLIINRVALGETYPLPKFEITNSQYVFSKNSNKYHAIDCSYVQQIKLSNRILLDINYIELLELEPCSKCLT